MPVNTTDARYKYNQSQWELNRDCYMGQRIIHKKGTKYLKPLNGMDLKSKDGREMYDLMKDRTLFFNATARTVDGLIGLIFRKDPINKVPDDMNYIIDDVDLSGKTLKEFEADIAREMVINGVVGIHTTMPKAPEGISAAEAENMNIRPYITFYRAEDILKVFRDVRDNVRSLSMVVLRENIETEGSDEFERESEEQYRVLDIANDVYRERVFNGNGELVSEEFPMSDGETFSYIPFQLEEINYMGKSPIEDLANANINHYQMNSSYTHGVFMAGFPTPTATGVSSEDIPTGIGPGAFWVSENADAKFSFLESMAGGADKGAAYLDKTEDRMAALGAEMLSPAKMVAETAESKRLDQQAQSSVLSTIAQTASKSIERALKLCAKWVGSNEDEVMVELNRDYFPSSMDANMLNSLVSALQSDSISYETFWRNMQNGELAPASKDYIEEKELIAAGGPNTEDAPLGVVLKKDSKDVEDDSGE